MNKLAVASLLICALAAPCSPQQLRRGSEPIPNAETFRASVSSGEGYPLEVFVTRPKGATGKLPVLFEVAWLSCDSVEEPKVEDGWTQLIWDLASRSGFATYRMNKPGVGASGGPKCSDLDWAAELAAYRSAFAAMKNFDFLDSSRVYVIGFSNGAGVAPLVADDAPVRGYLLFSGWYKTWLEHMLEHERRRMRLSGLSEPDITNRIRQYATLYDLYLNGKLTPGRIISQHPEFKAIWYDKPEHQYGRPAAFYQQLQELNVAGAWAKVDVPVLAVHGEYDWVMSSDDYKLLANALNSKHPGSAEFVEWLRADHLLYTHASEEKAVHRDPEQKYDPKLTEMVLAWLTTAEGNSQASSEVALAERLAQEYEKQAGLGNTRELDGVSDYINSVGRRVTSVLPSRLQYHFVFDPNPAFKSAFALPGGHIIVGGGLLALAQTEDELANALAHEIEHVELAQVSARVTELTKQKDIKDLHVSEFFPGYTKEEELACDLNGQKLAAKAGYSPAGMLTLLETFKALRKGQEELPSEKHPTLSERIAQAAPLAKTSAQKQTPLRLP